MSETKARRCRECGIGKVRPLAKAGRAVRYKTFPQIEIPADIEIPTCDHCGTEWTNDSIGEQIDQALERIYRQALHDRAVRAIRLLTRHFTQHRLEDLLGLSPGYLSKVHAGDRDPSAELVAHLALLARDPERRVQELEEYWHQSTSE